MMRSCSVLSGSFLVFSIYLMHLNSDGWIVSFGVLGFDQGVMSFCFDMGSLLFGTGVSFVVFQVYSYSRGYMKEDVANKYFFGPLGLFSGSMILLIFGGDLSIVFVAWDGLGVSSFLLVVYYSKMSSAGAGLITIMTNRLGDVCLLLGLGVSGFELFPVSEGVCCMLFVVAAFSKSAQWPLSSWLPAAMAAPTPVSALVHSSTLVTAGVYFLLRYESCWGGSLEGYDWLVEVGFFLSCLSACYSYDIKHIIAMSTLGHLSLMVLSLSAGFMSVTLFHLVSHALFKALTFLAAGNMIVGCGHSQDLRLMGGVAVKNPISTLSFLFSILSLSGFFFTSAFYSKDFILEVFGGKSGLSLSFLGVLLASLYAGMYACNLFDSVSLDEAFCVSQNSVETEKYFLSPLLSLSIVSLISGWYLAKSMVPFSSVVFSGCVDFAFVLGWFISGESLELMEQEVENSMLYLVDGVPEVKVKVWDACLIYVKDLEQGAFESGGGPLGLMAFCSRFGSEGRAVFEW